MGHREELLAAARRCLVERGYARTTARDLVAESGTNLASIGYHFGSKDALLAEALEQATMEYTEKVLATAMASSPDPNTPRQVVEAAWMAMTGLLDESRPFLVAFVEALAQAERNPDLRAKLAAGYEHMRRVIVEAATARFPDLEEADARSIGSFLIAMTDGLMVQALLDPGAAPSGTELLRGGRMALGA